MSIGTNIPDRVKTELNLAIAEAARTYQEENIRYFSRNRILDVETMMKQYTGRYRKRKREISVCW